MEFNSVLGFGRVKFSVLRGTFDIKQLTKLSSVCRLGR